MSKLKIAIIGCNNMGGKHLALLREHFAHKVEIAGILNSTPESTSRKAVELNVPAFKSLEKINSETVDGVIIATPVSKHYEYAKYCLERGIACLVEKPFALNTTQCNELAAISEAHKTPLLVGYVELYNPAVLALKNLLNGRTICKMKAIRTALSYGSNTDSTIVSNLMSHDFSVAHFLTDLKAEDIAETTISYDPERNLQSYARAKIIFYNGLKLKFESEIGANVNMARIMQVTDVNNNVFTINFPERKLTVNNQETVFKGNALASELEDFIHCIESGKKPEVHARVAIEIENVSQLVEQKLRDSVNLPLTPKEDVFR